MSKAFVDADTHFGSVWRFGGVGLLNTAFGLGVILLGRGPLGLSETSANAVGYGLGLLLSFTLNRNWTFRHAGAPYSAFWRFLLVVLVAWVANLICVLQLIDWGVSPSWSHVTGIAPYSLLTYLGCKLWAFRTTR